MVCGLNTAPSELPASGSFVRIFPSFALRITITGCGGWPAVLPVQREPVAATDVAEWIVCGRFHCFLIDDRDTPRRILKHRVERPLAIGDGLLRDAAEVDLAERLPFARVDDEQVLRRMT